MRHAQAYHAYMHMVNLSLDFVCLSRRGCPSAYLFPMPLSCTSPPTPLTLTKAASTDLRSLLTSLDNSSAANDIPAHEQPHAHAPSSLRMCSRLAGWRCCYRPMMRYVHRRGHTWSATLTAAGPSHTRCGLRGGYILLTPRPQWQSLRNRAWGMLQLKLAMA